MKEYLLELAELKAKEILQGLYDIKTTLNKQPTSLQSYVEYVKKLEDCQQQKVDLGEQKKKLEEMKGVLSKYRSKDEGYPNVS